MALDGIVIKNIAQEMREKIVGGRISKIAQPENDELILTIKNNKDTHKLYISASAGLPLIYFTDMNKTNPLTAPNFCMLLRKHIGNGKILDVFQPGLERIIQIKIEHLDEMGDLCEKYLIVEIMGKHSNIIFCDSNYTIIDSIKRVSSQMSSVREVLPGRKYFIPDTKNKKNPLEISEDELKNILSTNTYCSKTLYSSLTGISPVIAEEIVHLSGIDNTIPSNELSDTEKIHLAHTFVLFMENVKNNDFVPTVYFKNEEPIEFTSIPLEMYDDTQKKTYTSISQTLETYYATRNIISRIRQKSAELRKIVQTTLERSYKKLELQLKQMDDTKKRETYRIYGELLNTYGYDVKPDAKSIEVLNYYTNEMITIPLDNTLSPQENAKKYFDRYGKLKRTFEALTHHIEETKQEISHLESIAQSIEIALSVEDLVEIKEELAQYGYIKKHSFSKKGKKEKITSKPYHYISSDGFHIYIGKNNYQNEELTFKFAEGKDIWMHAKNIPGSHVIIKTEGKELPDRTYEEAGQLAAYYSKGRDSEKVEIDYSEKRNIKKPAGGKPGFVIYHTNYSLMATPTTGGLEQVN